MTAIHLANYSEMEVRCDNPAAAREPLAEAIELCLRLQERTLLPMCLEVAADLLLRKHQSHESVALLAAAGHLRNEIGHPPEDIDRAYLEALLRDARDQLTRRASLRRTWPAER